MHTRKPKLPNSYTTQWTLLFLLLVVCGFARAESDPETEYWYKVEICIFANHTPGVDVSEHWPEAIQLQYPDTLAYLRNPVRIRDVDNWRSVNGGPDRPSVNDSNSSHFKARDFDSMDIYDADSPRFLDNERSNVATEPIEPASEALTPKPTEMQDFEDPSLPPLDPADGAAEAETRAELADNLLTDAQPPLETPVPMPRAFELLVDEQMDLGEAVRKIRNSRHQRVLLHRAWYQPIKAQDQAPHLALRGGESFDEHRELEGSFHLYRERYLHITTNLWLSKFTFNIGQKADSWPIIPPYPFARQEDYDQEQQAAFSFQLDGGQGFSDQYSSFLDNQYVPERIALMAQRRRMRSKELHYIDHPLFGVLIQVLPYEPPAAESEAADH